MADLREALNRPGAAGKVVVFSQQRDALAHADAALTGEGIGTESVGVKGVRSAARDGAVAGGGAGKQGDYEGAIQRFRDDPDVKVLLLHAGSAAAGLTLTQADLVVLLEPFLSAGDEAQAANRVHRIGQTRPVRCVTYFVEGTVEERLLAYRQRQTEFGGGGGGCGGGGGEGGNGGGSGSGDKADELSVISDGADAVFGSSVSRAMIDRMRFIFGISDSPAALAEGGAIDSGGGGEESEVLQLASDGN